MATTTALLLNAEGFNNSFVVPHGLKRNEVANWFNDIIKNQVNLNHPGYEKLNGFPKVLENLLKKTEELYGVQSKLNLDNGKTEYVDYGDFYYPPLFQSHELWSKLEFELNGIFATISSVNLVTTIQLSRRPQSEPGKLLISLILANQAFPVILTSMEILTNEMKKFIEEAKEV